jgi:hypothetical protein
MPTGQVHEERIHIEKVSIDRLKREKKRESTQLPNLYGTQLVN